MAENSNGAANGQAHPQQDQAQLSLQRIYVKDVSFEAPGAPQIFQVQGQPNVELNLSQRVAQIGSDTFEVVLSVTATCKLEDKTAYLAEVHQAGIFGLSGFDAQGRDTVLSTYCPNVLFPYVRQSISDLVQNGGFPPFFLQPINFDALYAEQLRRRADAAAGEGANA
ncbi:protein-export chaperone SecB [Dokdonella soli]|uniref:Protein-export protein SecB n=1 Tax=Dokdonella soli TaxID=529810 RepID=A0ABN1IEI9_9GAMM